MNLKRICDSKLEEYQNTSQELSSNIYVKSFEKFSKFFKVDSESLKNNRSLSTNVLGNKLDIEYRVHPQGYTVSLNGKEFYKDKPGTNNAVNALLDLVTAEINGTIKVSRPKNRTIQKDRLEISPTALKKKGLKFPLSVYKLMEKSRFGEPQKIVKKNYRSSILTEPEYQFLKENEPDIVQTYKKYGTSYVSTNWNVFDLGSEFNSIDEAIARVPGASDFYDKNEFKKHSYFIYNNKFYRLQ